jgi:hypothetical protein
LAFIIAGVLTLIALAVAVRVLNRWSPNKA